MTKDTLIQIVKEVLAEETQEQTVQFDIKDINGVKAVLATYDGNRVGALRLKPYRDSYQVDSVIVKPEYRGYGIGKELYRLANDKLGPLYSDAHQSPDAAALWKSLIKKGEAKKDGDRFVMLKEGVHDPVRPGILKRQIPGKITCTKARALKSKQKNKGNNTAKAAQRFINYHC